MNNHLPIFSDKWFSTHQRILLFFCNNIFTKYIFRYILRINGKRSNIKNAKLLHIEPNKIWWSAGAKNKYNIEIRTHIKFAKRLYFAFKPLWQLIHFWDIYFANPFIPALNFGLDTFYPVAGANSPADGRMYRGPVNQTLSAIRAGAGSAGENNTVNDNLAFLYASSTSNQFQFLCRAGYQYDATSLGGDFELTDITHAIYGSAKLNQLGSPDLDIVSFNAANPNDIVAGDYSNFGTTPFGSITYTGFNGADYNPVALNSSGKAHFTTASVIGYGATLSWDTDNSSTGLTWGSGLITTFQGYFADETGTSKDPYILVTGTYPEDGAPWEQTTTGVGR